MSQPAVVGSDGAHHVQQDAKGGAGHGQHGDQRLPVLPVYQARKEPGRDIQQIPVAKVPSAHRLVQAEDEHIYQRQGDQRDQQRRAAVADEAVDPGGQRHHDQRVDKVERHAVEDLEGHGQIRAVPLGQADQAAQVLRQIGQVELAGLHAGELGQIVVAELNGIVKAQVVEHHVGAADDERPEAPVPALEHPVPEAAAGLQLFLPPKQEA